MAGSSVVSSLPERGLPKVGKDWLKMISVGHVTHTWACN